MNNIDDIYENKEYSPNKESKILIVFDNVIPDMLSNKNLNPIVTELFIRIRKLNISLVFVTQPYFHVPENITPNSAHCFIIKSQNKREFQQTTYNHSLDINFESLQRLYYLYDAIDTRLASDNPLRFRKNLPEKNI